MEAVAMASDSPAVLPALPPREIERLARESMRTGRAIDRLVAEALFGSARAQPKWWRDWTPGQIAAWSAAVRLVGEMRKRPVRAVVLPCLDDTWLAVLRLRDPLLWPKMPNVTWADLAEVLEVPTRQAVHVYGRTGWRFVGKYSTRRVERAPCRRCHRDLSARHVSATGLCAKCSGEMN